MDWVILTLLAAFAWAIVTVLDKFVSTREFKDFLLASTIASLIMAIILMFIPLFAGSPFKVSVSIVLIGILTGVIYRLATTFYLLSLKYGDASQVEPILDTQTLFVLVLSFLIFGESFHPIKYLGIIMAFAGAIILSAKKGANIFKFNKVLLFGFFAAFVYAIRNLLMKVATSQADVWTLLFWMGIGQGVIGWLFFLYHHPHMTTRKVLAVKHTLFISIFNTIAIISFTLALAKGSATLVSVVALSCGFFVFILATIFSKFYPKLWKEDLTIKTLARKLFAITMMVIGLIIVIV
jgi:drug/metabolite transporter (DMT)-like permease